MTPFALLETELQKEAARGDQLIKTLKAIATAGAHAEPKNAAHAATKLDKILGWGIQRSSRHGKNTAERDVLDFINKARDKGTGVMRTSSVDDVAGPRGAIALTGKNKNMRYRNSHAKKIISDSDPAYLNDPLARDYSQMVLDTLKRVTSGK